MTSLRSCLVAAIGGLAILLASHPVHAAGIDDARLKAAASEKDNWIIHGRDYTNQRFSPLDQINTKTVKRLVPKWIYQTGTASTFQTTPLVADGVMYLSAPFSHVIAVDAASGAELWRYDHKSTAKKLCCGPANRGVALGYGKVYVATVDARLIALDQKTGKVVWDIAIVSPDGGPTEDAANLAADALKDQNVTGSTGVGAVAAPLVANGLVVTGIPFGSYRASVTLAGQALRVALWGASDAELAPSVTHDFTMGYSGREFQVMARP